MASQILLYGTQPCDAGASSRSPPVLWRRVDRILLPSALSSIRAMYPKGVRRRDWIIAVGLGCPVSFRTSSFRTNWCHLLSNSIRRQHWWKASIFWSPISEIAQQSDPYRKIGRMHVLYNFSFVELEIRDLQIWLSRLCIICSRVRRSTRVTDRLPLLISLLALMQRGSK